MQDAAVKLDRVKRRYVTASAFHHKLIQFIRRAGPPQSSLVDYLDQALKSPRLRAIFEEARASEKARAAPDAK